MPSWSASRGRPSVGGMSPDSRAPGVVVRLLNAPVSARTWRATIFATLSGPLGIATFIVFWVLTAVGIPLTFVLLLGVLLLWADLNLAHQLARFESWRVANLLGQSLVVRRYDHSGGVPARIWRRLRSGGNWLELLYGMLVLPLMGWIGTCSWSGRGASACSSSPTRRTAGPRWPRARP